MKLTSVKMKPRKDPKPSPVTETDGPVYPWGLRLTLDEDTLAALGITELPKVGKGMKLMAAVDVVAVSENSHQRKGEGTHDHRSVELQITAMALERPGDKAGKKDEDVLYKG